MADKALSMAETFQVRMPCSAKIVIMTLKRTLLLRAKIQSLSFQFLHWFRQQMRERQSSIQDRLSHGFRARGWPSGKSENSLNVTGSYISKRKIPGQKSLGAKCLCCDVFAPRKARGLLSCCCLRSHIAFTCLQLRLNAIVVLHFLLLLSWLHLFLLYFFFLLWFSSELLNLSSWIKEFFHNLSVVQLVLF